VLRSLELLVVAERPINLAPAGAAGSEITFGSSHMKPLITLSACWQ
jgi:hypothetical protein